MPYQANNVFYKLNTIYYNLLNKLMKGKYLYVYHSRLPISEEPVADVVDGAAESKLEKAETAKVAESKSESITQEVTVSKEEVKVAKAKSESVTKQEVSVTKEGAKVTQATSESMSAEGEHSVVSQKTTHTTTQSGTSKDYFIMFCIGGFPLSWCGDTSL